MCKSDKSLFNIIFISSSFICTSAMYFSCSWNSVFPVSAVRNFRYTALEWKANSLSIVIWFSTDPSAISVTFSFGCFPGGWWLGIERTDRKSWSNDIGKIGKFEHQRQCLRMRQVALNWTISIYFIGFMDASLIARQLKCLFRK